jgi:proteasome lid subunit RPN8/RPN11
MTNEIVWYLPSDLLARSLDVMRPQGTVGNEGLAFWLGRQTGDDITITHMVSIVGPGIRHAPLQLRMSLAAMEALTNLVERVGCHLIGQIHSHPARMLDLSDVDKTYGIRIQNYLSLVCPHYAQVPAIDHGECGIHLFDQGHYRRLHSDEIRRRVHISRALVACISLEVPK